MSALPASEEARRGPRDRGLPAYPARPALGFVWPAWTRSPRIFLHTHHSPVTIVVVGFSPSPPPPLPSRAPLFSNAASPTRPGRLGSGRGPGVGSGRGEERGTHKAGLTPQPPPSLCKAAWDQRPAGWINSPPLPLPARLPPKGRPLPPKCTQERMTALDLAPTQPRRPPPRGGAGAWKGWGLHILALTGDLQPY